MTSLWMWTNGSKPRSNWPRVIMFHSFHKQCNDIIKGWFHCLTSESKERFLVNNKLMFGSTCSLVMVQIQFSSIKENKDWTSRTLANPSPSTSNNISFMSYLPTPPQSGRHMCITPHTFTNNLFYFREQGIHILSFIFISIFVVIVSLSKIIVLSLLYSGMCIRKKHPLRNKRDFDIFLKLIIQVLIRKTWSKQFKSLKVAEYPILGLARPC